MTHWSLRLRSFLFSTLFSLQTKWLVFIFRFTDYIFCWIDFNIGLNWILISVLYFWKLWTPFGSYNFYIFLNHLNHTLIISVRFSLMFWIHLIFKDQCLHPSEAHCFPEYVIFFCFFSCFLFLFCLAVGVVVKNWPFKTLFCSSSDCIYKLSHSLYLSPAITALLLLLLLLLQFYRSPSVVSRP